MDCRPFRLPALLVLFLLLIGQSLPAWAFLGFGGPRKETVTYTPAGWPAPLQGDLYLPDDKGKAPYPVLLLIHGGAWHKGDKESMAKAGEWLAEKGYAAFAINYRLAPRFHYPAPVEDAQEALRWLAAHASTYKLDTDRAGVWGYSAGAHLAALLAVQPVMPDVPALRIVIIGSAPTDLRQSAQPSVAAFLGGTPAERTQVYEEASPITRVHAGLPPFLVYYGSADTLVAPAQSESFAKALQDAGVQVRVIRLDGADHRTAAQGIRRHLDEVMGFLSQELSSTSRRRAAARP